MDKVRKYLFGGQDELFFSEHIELIKTHNSKMTGLIISVLLVVSLFYYVFDLNSGGDRLMRNTYLIFMLVFLLLHIIFQFYYKKHTDTQSLIILVVTQFVFMFLLLVGPIYDSGNLACFIPVYFIVMFLLYITPMHFTGIIALVDLVIFILIDINFKSDRLATYDMIDAITCLILGITIGHGILKDRLHEIEAFSILNAKNASELEKALALANKDALTGVRSRLAYETYKENLNQDIKNNKEMEIAVAMLDVNNMKAVNDNSGHEAGDERLLQCARFICNIFKHSPVFRIGGDEFVAILQGEDYENRDRLMEEFIEKSGDYDEYLSLSCGLTVYDPSTDGTVDEMFQRADQLMYERKNQMKQKVLLKDE